VRLGTKFFFPQMEVPICSRFLDFLSHYPQGLTECRCCFFILFHYVRLLPTHTTPPSQVRFFALSTPPPFPSLSGSVFSLANEPLDVQPPTFPCSCRFFFLCRWTPARPSFPEFSLVSFAPLSTFSQPGVTGEKSFRKQGVEFSFATI